MKQWTRADEWALYSNCQGDARFITPPERMSEHDREWVQFKCFTCKVRPECIAQVVETAGSGIFCAAVFVPEVQLDDSPRRARAVLIEAEALRQRLAASIPDELERRGEF